MRRSLMLCLPCVICTAPISMAAPPLWQQLVPRQKIEADPHKNYDLQQTHGPWLIMAASFTGEQGESQARELVLELRKRYSLPAFYYGMRFEPDNANPGRGLDDFGAPIKRRYSRQETVVEHAVLVGEFPTINAPEAQKLLDQIKHMTPESLAVDPAEGTSQSLAAVRQFQNSVLKRISPSKTKGPMGHAFLTRNPLLPKEYFVPQGVDPEVAKWNENVEYSLLNCKGLYSIRVATFRGRVDFQTDEELNVDKNRKMSEDDPLVAAAVKAHTLTIALREKGWEAYEFHDRHESYVTVGSFDDGQKLDDGRIALVNREAQIIMNTFGAATPNQNFQQPAVAVDHQELRRVKAEEQFRKQQFSRLFSQGYGREAKGFYPKQLLGLPFDIIPEPVRVPKKSISSVYARS